MAFRRLLRGRHYPAAALAAPVSSRVGPANTSRVAWPRHATWHHPSLFQDHATWRQAADKLGVQLAAADTAASQWAGGAWQRWMPPKVALAPVLQHQLEEEEEEEEAAEEREELFSGGGGEREEELLAERAAMREARRLLRSVHVEALKQQLRERPGPTITYEELLEVISSSLGSRASTMPRRQAARFAKALDDANVVLISRDTVYLNPSMVAQSVSNAIPNPTSSTKQKQLLQELSCLEQEKKEIDHQAHKHARKVLWCGLGYLVLQTTCIFRLTFWELSWDVMEPIAFFVTTMGMLGSYAFYMFTSSDPTYQDITKSLLSSKQQKLMKRRNFDMARLLELQRQYQLSISTPNYLWRQASP